MVIARWDPFKELEALQERVNRVFQERIGGVTGGERTWAPVVDAYEDQNGIVLRVELPGMKKDEIDIEITEDSITIRGERKLEAADDRNYVRVERPYGPFARTFAINAPIKSSEVAAAYRDGILEITIPKAEESKPKKVEVSIE